MVCWRRRLEWQQLEVVQGTRKSVSVRDVTTEARDKLEFPERVIQLALGYRHLVVVTATQCYIYTAANFNTPIIIELREGSVTLVLLADRYWFHLLIVGNTHFDVSYHSQMKLPSIYLPTVSSSDLRVKHEDITLSQKLNSPVNPTWRNVFLFAKRHRVEFRLAPSSL